MRSDFKKITINIPIKIYEELERRRTENGTTTTTEILSLVRFALKQEQAVDMLPSLITVLNEQKGTKKAKK